MPDLHILTLFGLCSIGILLAITLLILKHNVELFFYFFIGGVAGLLSGLLGVGGGVIIVPALIILLQHHPLFQHADLTHIAVATSLAAMIATSISSAYVYHRHRALIWDVFWKMTPGLCLGMLTGKVITVQLTSNLLSNLFAILLSVIAIHLFFSAQQTQPPPPQPSTQPRSPLVLIAIASYLIGLLSILFGIGGGILMVPLFLMMNFSIRQATGTAVLCGLVSATIGTLLLSQTEMKPSEIELPHMFGYVYWPAALSIATTSVLFAPVGAYLAFKSPVKALKQLFSVILLFSAWMLWH